MKIIHKCKRKRGNDYYETEIRYLKNNIVAIQSIIDDEDILFLSNVRVKNKKFLLLFVQEEIIKRNSIIETYQYRCILCDNVLNYLKIL